MSIFLAALAIATQPPAIATEPYRAQGSDPPWSVIIADGRITYESPGQPPLSAPLPPATNEDGETRYETREFSFTIMPLACTEKVSGRRYSDSVYVTLPRDRAAEQPRGDFPLIGGNLRSGCGGEELAADSLNGTSWHFAEIAGESTGLTGDLLRDDGYAIDFHGDGFVGYGGCNRIAGGYEQRDGMLTTRPPYYSTRRRCREPIMNREIKLLEILQKPARIGFPDSKTMVLTGKAGTIRLRRIEDDDDE